MNGLPGLFGSGVSEMFELKKLNHFLVDAFTKAGDHTIEVLTPLLDLMAAYEKPNWVMDISFGTKE